MNLIRLRCLYDKAFAHSVLHLASEGKEQCRVLLAELFAQNKKHSDAAPVKLVDRLSSGGLTIAELTQLMGSYDSESLTHNVIEALGAHALLEISAESNARLCTLVPRSRGFRFALKPLDERLTISRFTFLLPAAGGAKIETCHGTASGWVSAEILQLLIEAASRSGIDPAELHQHEQTCITMLAAAGFLVAAGSDGASPGYEEHASWEFHDLLFHTRTRLGRTEGSIGATYRSLGRSRQIQR